MPFKNDGFDVVYETLTRNRKRRQRNIGLTEENHTDEHSQKMNARCTSEGWGASYHTRTVCKRLSTTAHWSVTATSRKPPATSTATRRDGYAIALSKLRMSRKHPFTPSRRPTVPDGYHDCARQSCTANLADPLNRHPCPPRTVTRLRSTNSERRRSNHGQSCSCLKRAETAEHPSPRPTCPTPRCRRCPHRTAVRCHSRRSHKRSFGRGSPSQPDVERSQTEEVSRPETARSMAGSPRQRNDAFRARTRSLRVAPRCGTETTATLRFRPCGSRSR